MTDFVSGLALSPESYPQKIDPALDKVYFVKMSGADYRAASFLDDRVLTSHSRGDWIAFDQVQAAMTDTSSSRPIHFIFHTGHVGSTLLSRLLDETGSILGLREPLPLRTFAEAQDRLGGVAASVAATTLDTRLETLLRLWSRGFEQTGAVVLKATSSAARIAPRLLSARPAAKAVYLNVSAEVYITTLLAGANAKTDLNGFGPERANRLHTILDVQAPSFASLSLGELAAMSWLTETLTQKQTILAFGSRILPINFDALLADLEGTVSRVLSQFSIQVPQQFVESLRRSPVLGRYSKAPEQYAYSASLRLQLLNQARREHAIEIRKGLAYLEHIARQNARAAQLLRS